MTAPPAAPPTGRRAALALHQQGIAALQANDLDRAAALLRAAVAADETIAGLHANLGLALHALGDVAGAEAAYRRALALEANLATARNSLGTALQDQGRRAEAEAEFRAALALDPDYHEAAVNLGGALHALKRGAEALEILQAAVVRDPADPAARINLAAALKESGDPAAAEPHLLEALRLSPDDPEALVNLGLVREKQERRDEAEALYRQALTVAPGSALAQWNLALSALRMGRLNEGWPLYEARFAAEPDPLTVPPSLPFWRGEALSGKTLLVWREQGLGDDLLFGSLLPQLATRVATEGGRLIVAAEPRLVTLFARSLPGVGVVAAARGRAPAVAADLHCPFGALPGLLRPRLSDWTAAAVAWLRPDPALSALWRERLAALGPGLKVGVAWRSAVTTGERAGAYLRPADLAPAAAVPGVILINLQYDLTQEEAAAAQSVLGAPLAYWPDADLRNDLETAAALTAACDLVVSPASSVGETAASLGVPVRRFGGRDWTWLGTGVRPWFPTQKTDAPRVGESLADAVVRLAADLRRLAAPVGPAPVGPTCDDLVAEADRLRAEGRGADAEKAYQAALALQPGAARAVAGYAGLAREAGRPDLAAAILGGAVYEGEAQAERAAALTDWADLLVKAGEGERAVKAWWALILTDPGGDAGFAGLANLRAAQGKHPQALRGWERAIKADPTCGEWRYNQGNSLKALGRAAEADEAYRAAARCNPALALADFNRGYAALEQGRLAEGWDGLEKRFAAGQAKPDRRFSCPQWTGGALNGGDLLIWREQGIGDELMFAACYDDAIRRALAAGAGRVLIDAEPRLAGLFARRFAQATVRPWREGDPAPPGLAAHIPAGSLPALLRRSLSAFVGSADLSAFIDGAADAVFAADPARVEAWRKRLAALGPGLKVGICWRSGLAGADRGAAFSSLVDDWGPLLTLPDAMCVNLQYDQCEAELTAAEESFSVRIHRPAGLDLRDDLEGVAALISALDVVVATGTSVAELAGALGVPTLRLCRLGEWAALGARARPWFSSVRPVYPCERSAVPLADSLRQAAALLARLRPPLSLPLPLPPPPPAPSPAPVAETLSPAVLLSRAMDLHRAGRADEAAALYRRIAPGAPQYADARHLLGMIACAQNRFAEALADFDAAIAAQGRAPDYHANRAYALNALGRAEEAAGAARRALKLNSEHAEATANLGVALAAAGKRDEAGKTLRRALAKLPAHGAARGALADVSARRGDAHGAAAQYRICLALQPAGPVGWEGLGRTLAKLDPMDTAGPQACWRRALRLAPALPAPWGLLGEARRRGGDASGAAQAFACALTLTPDAAGALSNLAMARQGMGDAANAARLFARALAVDPSDGLSRFNRALLRLKNGDTAGGWEDYDGRLAAPALFPSPGLPYPLWRGEPLKGRRLLVWGEQGLGDELMFAALYPLLLRREKKVTLACDARLVGLFARSFPQAEVRALSDCRRNPPPGPPSGIAYQIAAGSLARLLAPRLADFVVAPGWLRPAPAPAAGWRARLDGLGPGLKIGVAWTSARQDAARARDYLRLADLAPLAAVPGVVLVSLQYDGRGEEIAAFRAATGLRLEAFLDHDLKNDLETAAALTAACDLVISVASSVGETAAALGVPVWRLEGRGWTRLGTGARPWHPAMRLFSPNPGERLSDTVARAALMLRRLRGGGAAASPER
jgi:tetratricopeptide (TPR) repeat protein/ADP-heptose:LPS heptosyltransferase